MRTITNVAFLCNKTIMVSLRTYISKEKVEIFPSNSNKNSTSNTNIREPILSNGLGSAANADPSAMQEHFTTSAKKVKEKLMLDEMHELLEEPVEEQVRHLFLKFPKLMIMNNAVL